MSSSELPEPRAPHASDDQTSADEVSAQAEAQRAADGLKDQIAAVRDRIRQARDALTEQARRENEARTFRRDR
ncbi:hypothetical protein LRS10_14170 [Phenylobacterium sp. J426]|uniref:hypothetical protein n=1 Tax=Phenylobacterium sp. J426 TaxID=2898439 RepID=UPI002151D30A|nr:hypothetical protein [Phenylobacterium sp. J426]MCR5875233.1 hypothetical protein [Phenylobacterium sp. J426]